MIDVKNFSHDIIYENIKNFCILNEISKESIKHMDSPPIIFEHILIDNKKRELTSTFKIIDIHPIAKARGFLLQDGHARPQEC